ncbi:hypothetical protein LUZ60_013583 [Juncus effusus]|nr:hypothetical protein LUZ60_013583 [Juncus effusus]
MEEAEHLCDRIGIIVSGQLQCIGTLNELKNRYGGSYRLTVSSDPIYKKNVERVISNLCTNSIKIYDLVGTQRYQLPRSEVRVGDIFKAIENLKKEVQINAFEVASSSLEDIFTEVVKRASQFKHHQDFL